MCWLCFAPQRAAHQAGEALSIGLRLLGGEPQAQLDGFKSRALRGAVQPAQRHLYATEWGVLEAATAAALTVLLLGERRPSDAAAQSTLRAAAHAPAVAVSLHHAHLRTRPLCALEAVLALVQAQAARVPMPTVWLLVATAAEHTGSVGLARAARAEALLPLRCVGASSAAVLDLRGSSELEAVVHLGKRLVPRLKTAPPCFDGLVRLHLHARGALSNLHVEPQPFMAAGPGFDILLRVRAVGLNFRDILNVLGEYPGEPGPPGGDAAGTVVQADAETLCAAHAAAFGAVHAPLASFASSASQFVASKPLALSPEQACTVPSTWSTVHAALDRAKQPAGSTTIVHAAAGGVGLQAAEYGHWLGATLVGTAGRPHKHVQLRRVGVQGSSSSHNGTASAMGGAVLLGAARLDDVLNSLSLDFIAASFALVREDGAFSEIGKRAIWAPSRHAASAAATVYCAIALDADMALEPM